MEGKKEMILSSEYTESLKMLHFLWCDSDAINAGQQMHKILLEAVKDTSANVAAPTIPACQI
jgi:hypothetical protein